MKATAAASPTKPVQLGFGQRQHHPIVTVESDPDTAEGNYEFDVNASRKNGDGFYATLGTGR